MVKKTRIKREYTVYDHTGKLIGKWYSAKSLQTDLLIKNPNDIYKSINSGVLITPYKHAQTKYKISLVKTEEVYHIEKKVPKAPIYVKLPKTAKRSVTTPSLYLTPDGRVFGSDAVGIYEIKPYLNTYSSVRKGYYKFHYRQKMYALHYELGRLFVPGFEPGLCINHIDGDSTNNNLKNLEWVTRGDNTRKFWESLSEEEMKAWKEKYLKGLKKAHDDGKYDEHNKRLSALLKGKTREKNPRSICVDKYSLDGEYIATYPTIKEAAATVDMHPNTLTLAIKTGDPKGGFIWKKK